jgi:hypothetical protein
MRLCLGDTHQGDRAYGRGLVEIEGEMFKVTLFSGSATEEWSAILQPTTWIEVEDDDKIGRAILREKNKPPEERRATYDPLKEVMRMLESTNPDLVKSIEVVMEGLRR